MLCELLAFTCFTNTTATYSRESNLMILTGEYDEQLSQNDKYTCKAYRNIAVRARVMIGAFEFQSAQFVYNEAVLNVTLTPTATVTLTTEAMANFHIEALEDTIEQGDVVQNLNIQYYNRREMFASFTATYGSEIELQKAMYQNTNFVVDTNGSAALYFHDGEEVHTLMQTEFLAADVNTWKNASQKCNPLLRDCAQLIQILQKSTVYSMWYEVSVHQNGFQKQQEMYTSDGEVINVKGASGVDAATECCYLPTISSVQLDARYRTIFRQNVTLIESKQQIAEISNVTLRIFEDELQIDEVVTGEHLFAPGYTVANLILCIKTDHTHCFKLQSNEARLLQRIVFSCRSVVEYPQEECEEDILDMFETQEEASATLFYQTVDDNKQIIEQFDVIPDIIVHCYENAVINIYADELCIFMAKRQGCSAIPEDSLIRLTIGNSIDASHVFRFPDESGQYCIPYRLSNKQMRKVVSIDPRSVSLHIKTDAIPIASVNTLARRTAFEWGWIMSTIVFVAIPPCWWAATKCKCSERRRENASKQTE